MIIVAPIPNTTQLFKTISAHKAIMAIKISIDIKCVFICYLLVFLTMSFKNDAINHKGQDTITAANTIICHLRIFLRKLV